ncbi:MAG: hypothetical protein NTW79_04190 [Candidatus Berkelbacteria bacterium]|nr:hypothetical protein [Candidatus Berkelbacteria bacterium]
MNGLFLFLFLVSIVCLVAGLIQPKVFSRFFKDKTSRKFVGLIFGIATVLFFVLFGVTSNKSTPTTSPTTTTKTETPAATTQKTETPTTTPAPKFIFDVPSLVGKNIDEVRTVLGSPADKTMTEPTKEQLSLGAAEWDNTFQKDGNDLLVTFDPTTRKIIDFFISTDDASGKTQDKNHLLEMGNLKENASNYKVDYVKTLKDSTSFTGVKATPKP